MTGVHNAGRARLRSAGEKTAKPVITVPADMDIQYVARLLYHAGIRRAPVEDQGELVGMVSMSSLILDNDLF